MVKFVKNRLGNYVSQLSLYESFKLAVLNSSALKQRTPEEQQKVRKDLDSKYFQDTFNDIENFVKNPFNYSNDFNWD
mgnify:CR=1 FL=1